MLRRHKPFKATIDYLLKPEKMGFSSIVDYPLTISRDLQGFCWLSGGTFCKEQDNASNYCWFDIRLRLDVILQLNLVTLCPSRIRSRWCSRLTFSSSHPGSFARRPLDRSWWSSTTSPCAPIARNSSMISSFRPTRSWKTLVRRSNILISLRLSCFFLHVVYQSLSGSNNSCPLCFGSVYKFTPYKREPEKTWTSRLSGSLCNPS